MRLRKTQSLKNRENVNNDLQESERNTENAQIEDNHKINICRNHSIGLEGNFCKNCRYRHYRMEEGERDRVCWFFGKPQGCRFGKQCGYYHPNMVEVRKLEKIHQYTHNSSYQEINNQSGCCNLTG